jgi:ABC-2 type transport system permease protein
VIGSLIRIFSFTGKELRETIRRPGILASLVLGPFLVMFLFGLGYTGARDAFDTVIVLPEGSRLPSDPNYYADLAPGRIRVVEISGDEAAARQRLVDQQIDVLIVAPENAESELRAGNATTVRVEWNMIDPVADTLAQLATQILVSSLNAEIVEQAAAAGVAFAEGELGPAVNVSPDVVARPTRAETDNVAPSEPAVVSFFGPAVFALVIQHLAITLTALSLVRERLSGQMDRFRVAPVTSSEFLIGKYVAFAVLSLIVTVIVGALQVGVLRVPLLSGWLPFAGVVLLLTFASLGVGLLISLVADSERAAVQFAMLVLLASVFFSGFILPVEDFVTWLQYVAYALPVTHGIAALQDLMLRGSIREIWMLGVLGGIGIFLYVVSLMRLRRVLHRAD